MKKITTKAAKIAAKLSFKAAVVSCNTTSFFGGFQPAMPKSAAKLKK